MTARIIEAQLVIALVLSWALGRLSARITESLLRRR